MPTVEKIYKIFDDEGQYLTVQPSPDIEETVEFLADGEDNKEYFGDIRLVLDPELAKKIANALLSCADDVTHQESQQKKPPTSQKLFLKFLQSEIEDLQHTVTAWGVLGILEEYEKWLHKNGYL